VNPFIVLACAAKEKADVKRRKRRESVLEVFMKCLWGVESDGSYNITNAYTLD